MKRGRVLWLAVVPLVCATCRPPAERSDETAQALARGFARHHGLERVQPDAYIESVGIRTYLDVPGRVFRVHRCIAPDDRAAFVVWDSAQMFRRQVLNGDRVWTCDRSGACRVAGRKLREHLHLERALHSALLTLRGVAEGRAARATPDGLGHTEVVVAAQGATVRYWLATGGRTLLRTCVGRRCLQYGKWRQVDGRRLPFGESLYVADQLIHRTTMTSTAIRRRPSAACRSALRP